MTGKKNKACGVEQSIATVAGAKYRISFYVGNLHDPSGFLGTTSTVRVRVNSAEVLAVVNGDGAGTKDLAWKHFTVEFTAASASTALAFVNGDPTSDNSNCIDTVSVAAV